MRVWEVHQVLWRLQLSCEGVGVQLKVQGVWQVFMGVADEL